MNSPERRLVSPSGSLGAPSGASEGETRTLTLDDIADLRAYEREREAFLAHVIELKKQRRIAVGPLVTLVFENRDTVRFQVQEMARAERMLTDEQIRVELDIYNPLIPGPGELSATLFIELGSKDELVEWLPKLVGIERSVVLRMGAGPDRREVRCTPEEGHAARLTRDEVTASVHYVRFGLPSEEVEAFECGPVELAVDLPGYRESVVLDTESCRSLLADLRPS